MEQKSFIEIQFPVSKVSKESYKERKANYSQTLTGLGKWWGRKPLVLVRAALLGLLVPASDNPVKDREIFLKILTMDEDGLWRRKSKNIALKTIYERLSNAERKYWFVPDVDPGKPKLKKDFKPEDRRKLQRLVFSRMSYDEKLDYCDRPEHVDGPSEDAWSEINAHLGTKAEKLEDLVRELGVRRFGRVPRVGDAFCGGGSVPFEAARMGCDVYASDLNPVAALLTWAALNIIGGGEEVAEKVKEAQREVYEAVDRQIEEWGIERNEKGWRADAYLYCTETRCPECGAMVPMAPSWVIGEKTNTIAKLSYDEAGNRFDIEIASGVSSAEMAEAKNVGTVKGEYLVCPKCDEKNPITMIRGDRRGKNGTKYGLRMWENDDIVPRADDVFQERLYCIRWVETWVDEDGKLRKQRYYLASDEKDIEREKKVLTILRKHFKCWQAKGFIPNSEIEPGYNTDQPIREKGWTHWHHLFTPRQLLYHGCLKAFSDQLCDTIHENIGCLFSLGRCCDWNARLTQWLSNASNEGGSHVFSNQALNTIFNYSVRPFPRLAQSWFFNLNSINVQVNSSISVDDATNCNFDSDIIISDPPYADAINYHELSEYFLAWYWKTLARFFPNWYTDSKRALAVTGSDANFRKKMIEAYRNLTNHMPENGMQIVMFTHQDAAVWADVALILWASGLRVTGAWTIGTETTDSSLKKGNYVQGTVLLVLRKQTSQETAFEDEIRFEVEEEVKRQLDAMTALEDGEDPNFGDTDYQLAAYAAALRVLTQYKNIEDLDIGYEISKPRKKGEASRIEGIIEDAVKIACDYLIPVGFDEFLWKNLSSEEKFYIKGLELESNGEYRAGAYQELSKGFGLRDYKPLLATSTANLVRLKNASEFGKKLLGKDGFSNSLVRHCLFAVREANVAESAQKGRLWLKTELPDYWGRRKDVLKVLDYFAAMENKIEQWRTDAKTARLVAGAVENDFADQTR